ncbi:DUF1889 family protein [Serratia oryzae]|uniref:BPL/LPL catalytic domain-containing protein n=1 Tax=Serratia oryzae TaxID=2034155 RepID=A0A1S8CKJ2_9GAMM|nr:DUF1889 family protein [Serratia oryzae]OMQ23713.1 hypothetical protein BMI79_09385 [Serratia oryzae]
MKHVLEVALKKLTARINLSTGLLHPQDESFAKELFKFLHKEKVPLHGDEITSWAITNGWEHKYAKELGDLAGRIGSGGRVVVKFKGQLNQDLILLLKGDNKNNP